MLDTNAPDTIDWTTVSDDDLEPLAGDEYQVALAKIDEQTRRRKEQVILQRCREEAERCQKEQEGQAYGRRLEEEEEQQQEMEAAKEETDVDNSDEETDQAITDVSGPRVNRAYVLIPTVSAFPHRHTPIPRKQPSTQRMTSRELCVDLPTSHSKRDGARQKKGSRLPGKAVQDKRKASQVSPRGGDKRKRAKNVDEDDDEVEIVSVLTTNVAASAGTAAESVAQVLDRHFGEITTLLRELVTKVDNLADQSGRACGSQESGANDDACAELAAVSAYDELCGARYPVSEQDSETTQKNYAMKNSDGEVFNIIIYNNEGLGLFVFTCHYASSGPEQVGQDHNPTPMVDTVAPRATEWQTVANELLEPSASDKFEVRMAKIDELARRQREKVMARHCEEQDRRRREEDQRCQQEGEERQRKVSLHKLTFLLVTHAYNAGGWDEKKMAEAEQKVKAGQQDAGAEEDGSAAIEDTDDGQLARVADDGGDDDDDDDDDEMEFIGSSIAKVGPSAVAVSGSVAQVLDRHLCEITTLLRDVVTKVDNLADQRGKGKVAESDESGDDHIVFSFPDHGDALDDFQSAVKPYRNIVGIIIIMHDMGCSGPYRPHRQIQAWMVFVMTVQQVIYHLEYWLTVGIQDVHGVKVLNPSYVSPGFAATSHLLQASWTPMA
ncbi:hypothetical protein EDD16DRAFT_1525170 [Pisolithus croceorrhizus]|nr:hypothetical protein EDD16DRAFT_1525170 [Pisolithus croceorrhizus]